MFRFLSMVFLAICLVDVAATAWAIGRVRFMGDIWLKRKTSPNGYLAVTLWWSLIAAGSVAGVTFLLYHAVMGSGPYRTHAFFSFYQA